MNQDRDAYLIQYRYERAIVAELWKKFGAQMEPQVKALYTSKQAVVAELEKKMGKG